MFYNVFIDHQNDYFKSKSQKKGGQCKSKNYTILSSLFSIISSKVFHKNIKFLKIFVTTLKIVIFFMTNLVGVFEMAYFYQSNWYTILNIFKHKVSSKAFLHFLSKFWNFVKSGFEKYQKHNGIGGGGQSSVDTL